MYIYISYLEPDRQTGTGPAGLLVAGPARSYFSNRPVFNGFLINFGTLKTKDFAPFYRFSWL